VPSIGLTLHELATNAAKYGALSTTDGGVDVHWTLEPTNDGNRVTLRWEEHGGPPVQVPERRGVGTALIEGGISHELDGRVEFTFAPEGLRCQVEFVV
jgi:two-component sensor histidine kinase